MLIVTYSLMKYRDGSIQLQVVNRCITKHAFEYLRLIVRCIRDILLLTRE